MKQVSCALWSLKEACSRFWISLAESQFSVFINLLAPAKMATLVATLKHMETTVRGCRNKLVEGNLEFDCGTSCKYEALRRRWYIQLYAFQTRSRRSACVHLKQWLQNPSFWQFQTKISFLETKAAVTTEYDAVLNFMNCFSKVFELCKFEAYERITETNSCVPQSPEWKQFFMERRPSHYDQYLYIDRRTISIH